MTAAVLAPIKGTISIGIDGHEPHSVASFEIPISMASDFDATTRTLTLHAASPDTIYAAMAEALHTAADELLATIPEGTVELADDLAAGAAVATCPDCDTQLATDDPTLTLQHAEDGAHVVDTRYV